MSLYSSGEIPKYGDVVVYVKSGKAEWTLTLINNQWYYFHNATRTQERCFRFNELAKFKLVRRADKE